MFTAWRKRVQTIRHADLRPRALFLSAEVPTRRVPARLFGADGAPNQARHLAAVGLIHRAL
jgi:hypothetical protein